MTIKENMNPKLNMGSGVIGGLVMIAVGVIFLVTQFFDFHFRNWWALFILIPVLVAWIWAAKMIRGSGAITQISIQAIMGSLFPLFVTSIFLFSWDWALVWPGFIVIAGLNALASAWGQQMDGNPI